MSASPESVIQDAQQQTLLGIYLPAMRQRFKAEVNRLSRGGMSQLLGPRPDVDELGFPLTYLYAWHWLRQHVPQDYREAVLAAFRAPERLFLMRLLVQADTAQEFVEGYVQHWLQAPAAGPVQQAQLLRLLEKQKGDAAALVQHLLAAWRSLGLFSETIKVAYAGLARQERDRYGDMLSEPDLERLALVDELPDPGPRQGQRFPKLGIIPAMGCPQTCRHCMFIWRPLKPTDPDPERVYAIVDGLTDNVLFTGGDLTRHMDAFYDGIRAMRHVTTFAILLNGDFADDPETTASVMGRMAAAIKARPAHWPKARVLLQISFDEFHQEVIVDKHGRLRERIPVAKIANIVECAPRHAEQIARGHQVQVLSTAPSGRLKTNPLTGERGKILKDASFVLAAHPDAPILLTSSTIDGYGRAELMEEGETVKERELLQQVLTQGPPPGESFDIDLMFWFNGWVT